MSYPYCALYEYREGSKRDPRPSCCFKLQVYYRISESPLTLPLPTHGSHDLTFQGKSWLPADYVNISFHFTAK